MMIKKIGSILAVVMLIASIIATYHAFSAWVAKAEDIRQIRQSIQKLNQRIDKGADEDRARDLQKRIWDLEAHYAKNPPMPDTVKKEIDCLKTEREQILLKWAK
jgi:cell division protein FtsL